jgi:hypothetical protein
MADTVAAGSGAVSPSNVRLMTARAVPDAAGEAVPEVAAEAAGIAAETAGESVTAR